MERDVNILAAGTGAVPAFLRAKSAKCLLLPAAKSGFSASLRRGAQMMSVVSVLSKAYRLPAVGGAGKAPQRIFTPAGLFAELERDVNILAAGTGIVPAFLRAKSANCFLLCSPPQSVVFRHHAAGGTDDVCRIGAVKSLPPPCGGEKVFSHSPSCRSEQPPPLRWGRRQSPAADFYARRAFCRLERDVNILAAGTGAVPAFLRAKSAKDLYFYRLVLYNKMIKYNKNIG